MNPIISLLTIKVHWFNIAIINIHASTEGKTREEKENFYDELVVDKIP